jgi:hypothetical protein
VVGALKIANALDRERPADRVDRTAVEASRAQRDLEPSDLGIVAGERARRRDGANRRHDDAEE